jgi:hypothetical protein
MILGLKIIGVKNLIFGLLNIENIVLGNTIEKRNINKSRDE